MVRNDSLWEDRTDLSNVFNFFEYHYNYTEDECAWRYVDVTCDDFSFVEGPCSVYISYSPCNDTDFYCSVTNYDNTTGDITDYEDCTDDFEDYQFWLQMREEQWWFDNWEDHWEFYEFWDAYHVNSTDNSTDDSCSWRDVHVTCDDFSFLNDTCDIVVSYSPCNTTFFLCDYITYEAGEPSYDDCTSDFTDSEFWAQLREE